MYCRECGQSIPEDSEFCPNCGKATGVQPQGASPQGGFGGQPAYPPPGAQAAGYGAAAVEVPNYLVQSILVTVLCCMPAGVAAIVYAAQANSKKSSGDYAGAVESAGKAKMWCWIALGAGAVVGVIYGLLAVVSQNNSGF